MEGKKKLTAKEKKALDAKEWRESIKSITDLMSAVPKEMYFGAFLTYLWSETHDGLPNKGDIVLGMLGGFTLPSALQGGWISGGWAAVYLSALGYNFADDPLEGIISAAGPTAGPGVAPPVSIGIDNRFACKKRGGRWVNGECIMPAPPPEVPPTD